MRPTNLSIAALILSTSLALSACDKKENAPPAGNPEPQTPAKTIGPVPVPGPGQLPPGAANAMPPGHPGMPAGHPPMPGGAPGGGTPPMMQPGAMGGSPPPAVDLAATAQDITPSGQVTRVDIPGLTFEVPTEWISAPPTGGMRLAQWKVPGPGGDSDNILYGFSGGGDVQSNINRWQTQFTSRDAQPMTAHTTSEPLDAGGLSATLVEIRGNFKGSAMSNQPPIQDAVMLAAIVDTPSGLRFFKLTGPAATVDLWKDAFRKTILSINVIT